MRYTMIVDGHNFMFKTLCTLPTGKGGKWLETGKDVKMFNSKLMINFVSGVKDFRSLVGGMVFAVDSSSWRRSLREIGVGDFEYKAGRHTEEKINWENFKACASEFLREISSMGVTVSKARGAEADDLIFYWASRLTEAGVPVIINSSDKDMLQLVRNSSGSGCECLQYSTVTRKLYVPQGFVKKNRDAMPRNIEEFLLHGGSTDIVERYGNISELVKKKKFEIEEVDADRELVVKVLAGDKSDNIPSVYTVVKNGKTFGITELKAGKILAAFNERTGEPFRAALLFDDSAVNMLAECVCSVCGSENPGEAASRIRVNTRYICLSYDTIPEQVVESMRSCSDIEAQKKKRVDADAIASKDVKPVEITVGALKGADDTDFSFIKDRKKLF